MSGPLAFLVPCDGSAHALAAARHVLDLAGRGLPVAIHLLNVQPPVRGAAGMLVGTQALGAFHREEGMAALAAAQAAVEAAGLVAHLHIAVGAPGEVILAFAAKLGCGQIAMGTRGYGGVAGTVMGSVAADVIARSPVPVTLLRAG